MTLRCPHVLMGSQVREAAERRARAAAACTCDPWCYPAADLGCPVHGVASLLDKIGADRLGRAGADTPPETA